MKFSQLFRAAFAVALLAASSVASAAGISISPLKFELNIDAGKQASGVVKVTNDTGKAITLYTSKQDFVAGDDTGTPAFVKVKDQTSDQFSLSNWISIEDKNLTLAQGETREVRFTVSPPAGAEPGGHYGAVFFAPASEKGQVAIITRIGALILVNVPGATKVSGSLDSFDTGTASGTNFQAKSSFEDLPVSFATRFKNDGNVHLKPTGKIELVDENGEVLKSVGKEAIVNPQGAFIGEKLVDYIPVNDGLGNVLPNSDRRFDSVWEGFGYPIVNDDGTKDVKFKTLAEYYADKTAEKQRYLKFYESVHTRTVSKKITANLALSYEAKDASTKDFHASKTFTVTYDEEYVGFNYALTGAVLVLLAGITYYLLVIAPKARERLRKELMDSIRKSVRKEEE